MSVDASVGHLSFQGTRDRGYAAGLLLVGLALRAVHLATVRHSPLFEYLFIDPRMYDEWAQRIAAGRWLADAPFFLDPLYPYFVAGVFALFGHGYLAVAVVQSLLGALVPLLVFAAARSWLERPIPHVAGAIAALYAPSIFWGGVLMKPGLGLFAAALTLWLLSVALGRGGSGRFAAAGASMATVCMLRGPILLALPVVAAWVALAPRARDARRVHGWDAAAFLLGAALVLALPAAHNVAVSGEPILTPSTNWGQIFFIGNNPANPTGRFEELPFVRSDPAFEQSDFKSEAERRTGRALAHREVSRFWFGEGWAWARSEPLAWARVLGSKLRLYWGSYEMPASVDYYLYRRSAPVLRLPLPGFSIVGPFALLGCVLAWRRGGWPRLLVLWVAAASLATVTFFVLTRFRIVALPALFVLAAIGAVELVRRTRRALSGEGRLAALLAAGLLLVFFAFVDLPVRATADTWSYRIAAAAGLPTRLETTANAHFNLGVTYARAAKDATDSLALLGRAETELREALREEPRAKMYVELGKVLARLERNDEAIASYREALALAPGDPRVAHSLGLLEHRVGNLAAAEAAFRRALALEPRQIASAVELGEVLLALGRPAEATAAFRHALRVRPDDAAALRGLAVAEAGSSR